MTSVLNTSGIRFVVSISDAFVKLHHSDQLNVTFSAIESPQLTIGPRLRNSLVKKQEVIFIKPDMTNF